MDEYEQMENLLLFVTDRRVFVDAVVEENFLAVEASIHEIRKEIKYRVSTTSAVMEILEIMRGACRAYLDRFQEVEMVSGEEGPMDIEWETLYERGEELSGAQRYLGLE